MYHKTLSTPAFVLSNCQQCFGHFKNKCSLVSHVVNHVFMYVSDCMKQNFILIIIRERISLFCLQLVDISILVGFFNCDRCGQLLKEQLCLYLLRCTCYLQESSIFFSIGLVLLKEGSEGWHIPELPQGFCCCIAHGKPCVLQQNTEFKFQIKMVEHSE